MSRSITLSRCHALSRYPDVTLYHAVPLSRSIAVTFYHAVPLSRSITLSRCHALSRCPAVTLITLFRCLAVTLYHAVPLSRSITLSRCHALSRCPAVTLYHAVPLSRSITMSRSITLSRCHAYHAVPLSRSITLSRYHALSRCPAVTLYHAVPLSRSITLSRFHALSRCPAVTLYHDVPLSRSIKLSRCHALSRCPAVTLFHAVPLGSSTGRISQPLLVYLCEQNKVVLVTGASSGIGKATAILFAARGARLALVGRNEQNLRAVADSCASEHQLQHLHIVADLATDEGCERTAKQTLQHFGRLDVLVNCAGVAAITSLETADMASFDRVFGTVVRGAFNLTRLLAPALIAARGSVVNVSSVAATLVHVGSLPYGMAKAALDHFTRLIALELAPKGVRVNTVSPGITNTPLLQRLTGLSDEDHSAFLKNSEARIPMRCTCEPVDVARVIAFLAGDQSRLVTGTTVKVDGGLELVGIGEMLKDQNEEMRK